MNRAKLLIIDDDRDILMVLRANLELQGFINTLRNHRVHGGILNIVKKHLFPPKLSDLSDNRARD